MNRLSDKSVEQLLAIIELPEIPGGRYEIAEQLGRGGMGIVFRATDTLLQREVALKVMNAASSDQHFEERLKREARVLAQLEHPGIVPVYDAGRLADGRVYYVMRLVRGERLDAHASQQPARGALMRHFLRVCEAVAFAHSRGIIHRDLKPANIMIGTLGEVLVLDWGVARRLNSHPVTASDRTRDSVGLASGTLADSASLLALAADDAHTHAQQKGGSIDDAALHSATIATVSNPHANTSITSDGTRIGTPGFMAPEQEMGRSAAADERSDVYGLGAILSYLVQCDPAPAPRPLLSIVARSTAPGPNDRYPSASELADDVRHWLDGEPVSAHTETTSDKAVRLYNRHQTAILIVAGYVLVRILIFLERGI